MLAKMTSKSSVPSLLPSMPDLEVGEDDDAEVVDEKQDENHLMSILQKLKSAKQTLDSSRQKKKVRQLMEQSTDRFHSEADELVNKHNKRWTTKFNAVQLKMRKLKISGEETLKGWKEVNAECEQRLKEQRVGIRNILHSLRDLGKDCNASKDARNAATKAEITNIRIQVAEKLKQVQGLLIKTHTRSIKDDKFTMLIKSFITSL